MTHLTSIAAQGIREDSMNAIGESPVKENWPDEEGFGRQATTREHA
jgi:hypothetical protein